MTEPTDPFETPPPADSLESDQPPMPTTPTAPPADQPVAGLIVGVLIAAAIAFGSATHAGS